MYKKIFPVFIIFFVFIITVSCSRNVIPTDPFIQPTGTATQQDTAQATATLSRTCTMEVPTATLSATQTITCTHSLTETLTMTPTVTPTFTFTTTFTPTATLTLFVDLFEPDDDWTQSSAIAVGGHQTRSMHWSGDDDWVTFTLAGAAVITLETSGPGDNDTAIWLYDSAGVPGSDITSDDDGGAGSFSRIEIYLGPGTYYARVWSSDFQEIPLYYLDLSGVSPSPTFTATCTHTNSVTNTYTFTDTHTATFSMTATPSFTATLTDTPYFTPTSTRTAAASADIYEEDDTLAQARTVLPGMSEYHTVYPQNESDYWTITLTENMSIEAVSSGHPGNEIRLDAYYYDGVYNVIDTVTNFGSTTLTFFATPGVYYIQASNYGGVEFYYNMAINGTVLSRTPTPSITLTHTLTFTVTRTITQTGTATGTISPTVTVTLTRTSTYTPTFTVTMTNTRTATQTRTPSWLNLGSGAATDSTMAKMDLAGATPVVYYNSSGLSYPELMRFNGASFTSLGSPADPYAALYLGVAVDSFGGIFTMTSENGHYYLRADYYNGSWDPLGDLMDTTTARYVDMDMCSGSNKPYVVYTDQHPTQGVMAFVRRYVDNSTGFVPVSGGVLSTYCSATTSGGATSVSYTAIAVTSDGYPMIAYRVGNTGAVRRYNGTQWNQYTFESTSMGTDIDLEVYGTGAAANVYVVYKDASNQFFVKKLDSSNAWTTLLDSSTGYGTAGEVAIDVYSDVPAIAFHSSANGGLRILKYSGSGTTWNWVGSNNQSVGTATQIDMKYDASGALYVLYNDANDGYLRVKKWQ